MPGFDDFIPTNHADIYPAIDPSEVKLPKAFTVLILGASRGIGAGIAEAYARAGASTILLSSRRISGLEEVAEKCRSISPLGESAKIEIIPCDITDAHAVADVAAHVEQTYGRLDACIVNSGYAGDIHLKIEDTPVEEFQRAIDVNYVGTFLTAKYCLPLLKKTDGAKAFLAVGSLVATITAGPIANPQYCVSKHAQARLVEMIASQCADDGVLAVAVHPGAVLTEMAQQSKGAEAFHQYLTDKPELCGGFLVWLSQDTRSKQWLSGRLLSAKWDVEELVGKRSQIENSNKLRAEYI